MCFKWVNDILLVLILYHISPHSLCGLMFGNDFFPQLVCLASLPNGLIMKPEPCPLESKLLPEHSKIDRPPILSTLMRTPAAMAAAAVAAAASIKQQTAVLQKTDQIQVATVLPTVTKMESSPPAKELSKPIQRKRSRKFFDLFIQLVFIPSTIHERSESGISHSR